MGTSGKKTRLPPRTLLIVVATITLVGANGQKVSKSVTFTDVNWGTGGGDDEARAAAERDFDENLRSATYALCIRGTGNFSARFFEALSFGRIPLFVDTRCVLPFEDEIDWSDHLVRVEAVAVGDLADRLVDEHRRGTDGPRSAEVLRGLWQDRLTRSGFYAHLPAAVRRLL